MKGQGHEVTAALSSSRTSVCRNWHLCRTSHLNNHIRNDQMLVRLPRLQRAGPSTSLDKSADKGCLVVFGIIPREIMDVKQPPI